MKVLIIGSGRDLDGRLLAGRVDGVEWDVVVRVNKPYGRREDVGARTDVVYTRNERWLEFFKSEYEMVIDPESGIFDHFEERVFNLTWGRVVLASESLSRSEYAALLEEVGVKKLSAGFLAVSWALREFPDAEIDVVGFQLGDEGEKKVYAETGVVDENPSYEWSKEHAWILAQGRVNAL